MSIAIFLDNMTRLFVLQNFGGEVFVMLEYSNFDSIYSVAALSTMAAVTKLFLHSALGISS